MHAVTAIGLALSVAGCDRAFGLHRDLDIDAPANLVTGTFRQRYVANDENFAPRTGERIFEPTAIDFAVTLDDGSKPAVDYQPDGTFSFAIPTPGQAYRIAVTADGSRLEYQSSAPHLTLASLAAGHPIRLPVVPTKIEFPYPAAGTAMSGARITSTGIYTSTESGLFGPTVTFDWRLAIPATNASPGLLDAAQHDRVYAMEYVLDYTTIPTVAAPYLAIRAGSRCPDRTRPRTSISRRRSMIPTPG